MLQNACSSARVLAAGGLWGKAKNMFGLGGAKPRSAAEEEELLEELAEEEEDAEMMESVLGSRTAYASNPQLCAIVLDPFFHLLKGKTNCQASVIDLPLQGCCLRVQPSALTELVRLPRKYVTMHVCDQLKAD